MKSGSTPHTTPGTEEVEPRREQRPRGRASAGRSRHPAPRDTRTSLYSAGDTTREGGGRAGTATEESEATAREMRCRERPRQRTVAADPALSRLGMPALRRGFTPPGHRVRTARNPLSASNADARHPARRRRHAHAPDRASGNTSRPTAFCCDGANDSMLPVCGPR